MRSVKEGLSCPIPSNMTSEPKWMNVGWGRTWRHW
jgi:hypothetical protein